jgi:catechol 2,3-dioxygenase-like lactoylglutathione lyase family enzyme
MDGARVSAVLFVKNLEQVAAFYSAALGMKRTFGDQDHSVLNCHGFELIVHQIPRDTADKIVIERPPKRRVWGAIRLDYPVHNIEACRRTARSLGGDIDDVPPGWADKNANFFFGYDPEGNQFGVSQHTSEVPGASVGVTQM